MPSCSTWLSNKLLDHVFGKTAFEADDTLVLHLYSTVPNSDGSGGTEISDGGYAPIELDNDTTTWGNASGRQKLNDLEIDLPEATEDWVGIVAWKLKNLAGDIYTFGRTPSPVLIKQGEARKVPIGKFIQNLT